jgi:hypothetical protein
MRIQELIETELPVKELSYTDPGIEQRLVSLGYSLVPKGKGKDQSTWTTPNGEILKIFGTQLGQKGFSEDHKMFAKWVQYTEDHANNRYMPKFSDWASFEYPPDSNQKYLQIKMERLSPVPRNLVGMLEQFDIFVEDGRTYEYLIQIAKKHLGAKFNNPAIQSLFKDSVLWDTVLDLYNIAERQGWGLDLHARNYMMRGDQVVIVDPWVAS